MVFNSEAYEFEYYYDREHEPLFNIVEPGFNYIGNGISADENEISDLESDDGDWSDIDTEEDEDSDWLTKIQRRLERVVQSGAKKRKKSKSNRNPPKRKEVKLSVKSFW